MTLPRKMWLQGAVAEAPCRPVRFEEVAGGSFVEEGDEAEDAGTVELPAEEPVLEDARLKIFWIPSASAAPKAFQGG